MQKKQITEAEALRKLGDLCARGEHCSGEMVEKLRSFDIYNAGKKKHKLEYSYDLPPEYMWTIDHVRTLKNKTQSQYYKKIFRSISFYRAY